MIHLSTMQQIDLRKALIRVTAFASKNPGTSDMGSKSGPMISTELDFFTNDFLKILGMKEYQILTFCTDPSKLDFGKGKLLSW